MSQAHPDDDVPMARRLARQALAADLAALPAGTAEKLRTCLLDFLSCAFESRDLPWSRQAAGVVRPVDAGAHVVGTGIVAAPAEAAFANAVLGHGLVREDMHAASIGHHGVVVWPTLLALAEDRGCSGAALLAAAAVGYEAGGRIGRALITADLARLHRPTGLVSPVAAALAGARLAGLGEDATVAAVALAANAAAGLNAWPHEGGEEMYFHPAFAARNAVTAVELARLGAHGSARALDGEGGLFAAFRRAAPPDAVELFPGGTAEVAAVYNKAVPACNFAQTACQAALAAGAAVPPGTRIEAVVVRVSEAARRYPGCDAAGPFARPLQAKMSIRFGVAAALAGGALTEESYRRLDDPEVLRLVRATRLEADAALSAAFPAAQGAEVALRLADGGEVARRLDDVVPATPQAVRARFRSAAAATLGDAAAAAIEAFVDGLETAESAGALPALCAAPRERRP